MKLFICICLLIFITNPFVSAESFNFRDLFLDSDYGTSSINPLSSSSSLERSNLEIQRSEDVNTSFPSDNQNELDSDVFSSSEEARREFESLNSSDSDIFGVSDSSTLNPSDKESTVSKEESTEEPLSNQSPSSSRDFYSSFASSTVRNEEVDSERTSTSSLVSVSTSGSKESIHTNDPEEVILGTTETTTGPVPKTVFQKSIEWVEDAYTLSILIPIAAGILFATACIITIALCRCLRRCCRRRRFKRKVLPDSVKNLRPSDRARLLGDCSSDEEF